jgi:O-antigen ligase
LSLDPRATRDALILFSCFAIFLLGTASLFSVIGVRRLLSAFAVLGATVGMIGIIQEPLYQGRIYGFWTPEQGYDAFGPFVNRNHFAGWMLMALPLTLGLLRMRATQRRPAGVDVRDRALWLASPDGSKLILLAAAVGVMALALVLTLSRSGIIAFGLAILTTGRMITKGREAAGRGRLRLLYLGGVATLAVGVAGFGAVASRFSTATGDLATRVGVWRDALHIASLFPWTGVGVNAFGDAMLLYQTADTDTYYYSAAHNDYLQILADGGLLLAVPVAAAVVLVALAVRRRLKEDRGSSYYWLRAGAVTALVAIAIQELGDFSLQMPGNAVLFAVVCAIAIHRRPKIGRPTSSPVDGGRVRLTS